MHSCLVLHLPSIKRNGKRRVASCLPCVKKKAIADNAQAMHTGSASQDQIRKEKKTKKETPSLCSWKAINSGISQHETPSQSKSGKFCCCTLDAKRRKSLSRTPSPHRIESTRSMSTILVPALAAIPGLRLHQVFLTARSSTSASVVLMSAASSASELTSSAAAPVVERWTVVA